MKVKSVRAVFFSPTGTSKKVVQGIVSGLSASDIELVDITKPDARKQQLQASEDELLIVAVPVYMGRVPALINGWLNSIKASNTPVVCVVVYGNRAYEDALLELKNIVSSCGCVPIAGAAYIGEHSFSHPETPTAQGRPNEDDLSHAKMFGQKIREKLESISEISQIPEIQVPGNYPYERSSQLWDVDFIEVGDLCVQCGVCAQVCPAGAVDAQDSRNIDPVKCITCCACIKRCPQNAKTMKPSLVKDAQKRLNTLFNEPKEPECFL